MKGSWNGRCRKGEYVHIIPELLYLFLVSHSESLLFIYNKKSQILKYNILRKQPVGSYDNIHQSAFYVFYGLGYLSRCPEAAEKIHPYGEILKSFHEGIVMLLGEYGGGHKIGNLLIFLYRLKCGS